MPGNPQRSIEQRRHPRVKNSRYNCPGRWQTSRGRPMAITFPPALKLSMTKTANDKMSRPNNGHPHDQCKQTEQINTALQKSETSKSDTACQNTIKDFFETTYRTWLSQHQGQYYATQSTGYRTWIHTKLPKCSSQWQLPNYDRSQLCSSQSFTIARLPNGDNLSTVQRAFTIKNTSNAAGSDW